MTTTNETAKTVNLPAIAAAWVKAEQNTDKAHGKAMAEFRQFFAGIPTGDQTAYSAREKAVKAATDKALESVTPEQRKAYTARRRVYLQRIRDGLKVAATESRKGGRQPVKGKGKGKGEDAKDPLTACNAALATLAHHYPKLDDAGKTAIKAALDKITA